MKSFKTLLFVLFTSVLMASCSIHSSKVANVNNNNTNVELSKKNFKVIERVSGKSEATYFFGIGGLSNKALVEAAKSNMLANSSMIGSSRAVVNVTVELHRTLFMPVYYKKTVIATAYVVEFTK